MTRQEFVRALERIALAYQLYGVRHNLVEDLRFGSVKTFCTRMLLVCRENPRGLPYYPKMVEMAAEVCVTALKYHDYHVAPAQVTELVSWISEDGIYRMLAREGRGKSPREARALLTSYVRGIDRYLEQLVQGDLTNVPPRRVYELLIAEH
jgi:hypothetical protein